MNEKLDEIIEFLSNTNCGGEHNCAIENHRDVLKEYGLDDGLYYEICCVCGDLIEGRGDLEDFLEDYYKSVIKSVCVAIATFKE